MLTRVTVGFAGIMVAVLVLGSTPAEAVNCKFVMKNLSTGRTAEQIAETMMISVDEVNKCAEQAAAEKAAKTGEKEAVGEGE